MVIVEKVLASDFKEGTYIALGSFDGLHIGHRALIDKINKKSKEKKCKSMVYTFKNHPLTTINKEKAPKLIINNETKVNLLQKLGIDYAAFVDFDEKFMKMTPEEFIENLVKTFNVKGIVVGFNYRFGYRNLGDTELLQKLSYKFKFELIIIDALMDGNDVISSSLIRRLIRSGNVDIANKYLMEPFLMKGSIVCGKKLGRKLGFPTANLNYNENSVVPKQGIYYTNIKYNKKIFKGITNIGYNPTVNGQQLTIETFVLDFNKEIYGETIEVYFINKFRDEIKFSSLEELISQLKIDESYARSKEICIKK